MTDLARRTHATLPRLSHVVDALDDEQIGQLAAITDAILGRIDPDGEMAAT